MSITAKIIADSKNEFGNRLTTFVLTFPRIVLAEFNTHRMLSKNSASSRAIPFAKMLKMVEEDPFIPIRWMKEHKGMQGTEYFTDAEALELLLLEDHLEARDNAVKSAKKQSDKGLTKQVVNRYLEPFMWHTAIITSSEWENFFALRAHPAAEIHIADLAEKMLIAYNESTPRELKDGEWHIPFGELFDMQRLIDLNGPIESEVDLSPDQIHNLLTPLAIKIATARCARVSYLNFEGKDDYEADIKLHDILLTSGHMSPFEHCAKVMSDKEYNTSEIKMNDGISETGWCGNFRGFTQYRKTLKGENKSDPRVLKNK